MSIARWRNWRERAIEAGVCAALLSIVALACVLPVESSVAVLVCAFFFGLGVVLLSLVRDERQRSLLLRLFIIAFLLRLIFTMLAYALDIIAVIGGADDGGWLYSWYLTRFWNGEVPAPPNVRNVPGLRPPTTFIESLSGDYGKNRGWFFYAANILYLLNTPSQIALACFNNFLSSLTPCVIFAVTRKYFSEKASLIAAGSAVIFPGFIAWSALTLKEPWLIFLEIFVFYLFWKAFSERRWWLLAPAAFFVLITYTMRFYIGYVMVAAIPFIILGTQAKNPKRASANALAFGAMAYAMGSLLGVVHIDLLAIIGDLFESMRGFSGAISGANGGTNGTATGVILPFDPTTPDGIVLLLLYGMAYLLLSPFPWSLSGKQILTLPDVAIWWFLVFAYIIPGVRYAWRKYPGQSVAIWSYLAPLILVYSFSFGNIGLAYRQRAQLMPFFLFFAAAGYDARRKQKREAKGKPSVDDILEKLRQAARTAPQLPQPKAPEPAMRAERPAST